MKATSYSRWMSRNGRALGIAPFEGLCIRFEKENVQIVAFNLFKRSPHGQIARYLVACVWTRQRAAAELGMMKRLRPGGACQCTIRKLSLAE